MVVVVTVVFVVMVMVGFASGCAARVALPELLLTRPEYCCPRENLVGSVGWCGSVGFVFGWAAGLLVDCFLHS